MRVSDAPPLWLRVWHGVQALLFLALLASGISMHYAGSGWEWLSFSTSVRLHNGAGLATALLWLGFIVVHLRSGHGRRYLPRGEDVTSGAMHRLRYYVHGMFIDDEAGPARRLANNPLQQISYAFVMYALLPLSIGSGSLLMAPVLMPERMAGRPGLWHVAIFHLIVGYLLTLFLVVHLYMATTGRTVFSLYREIVFGVQPAPTSLGEASPSARPGDDETD